MESHTVADLAVLAAEPAEIGRLMRFAPGYVPDDEDRRASAVRLLATALGTALHDGGWAVAGAIGEPLTFHKGGETLEPFSLIELLVSDEGARAAWSDRARSLGISSLLLNAGVLRAATGSR